MHPRILNLLNRTGFSAAVCALFTLVIVFPAIARACDGLLLVAPPSDRAVEAATHASVVTRTKEETEQTLTVDSPSDACCDLDKSRCDEIWVISSRRLGCPRYDDGNLDALRVRHYDPVSGWVPSSIEEFFASEMPDMVTCFYVHGARIDEYTAIERARRVQRLIVRGADPSLRFRFVLWSWRADREPRPLRALRAMAVRADTDAYYFGELLSQFGPESKVSMIGFSMGARVATGGLHVLCGGKLVGHRLPREPGDERPQLRCVLWLAAVHTSYFYPNARLGRSLHCVDALLNLYNPCDEALERYHLITKCGRPDALGYTGFRRSQIAAAPPGVIEQRNLSRILGREHSFVATTSSSYVIDQTRPYVFWEPLDER